MLNALYAICKKVNLTSVIYRTLNFLRFPIVVKVEFPIRKHAWFIVRYDSELYRTTCYGGEYEVLVEFSNALSHDSVVVDVGGSVGLYSIMAAICAKDGRVISFEPDQATFKRLKQNIRLNGLKNVTALPYALGDAFRLGSMVDSGLEGGAPKLSASDDAADSARLILEQAKYL